MKITKKSIKIKIRHRKKRSLVAWLIKNPEQQECNRYRQDALLMACVENPNLTDRVFG
jgi:hypothetical protein